MEETVDVRALRARFNAQTEITAAISATNGTSRTKPALAPPSRSFQAPSSPKEKPRSGGSPWGVFPQPPPKSHRTGDRGILSPATPPEPERAGRIRATGELLQNLMLQHQTEHPGKTGLPPPPPSPPLAASPLHRLRGASGEVTPLRRTLPPPAPRGPKPKRPPNVKLRAYQQHSRPNTEGLPRPPKKPTGPLRSVSGGSQPLSLLKATEAVPPPPLHPKYSRDSCQGSFSSQKDEDGDQSDTYEAVDDPEEFLRLSSSTKKSEQEFKHQPELFSKELKERMKKAHEEYKRKFKLTDPVDVLHVARVRQDCQGGKGELSVRQGESVEIIRMNNNPGGKWLARTTAGAYGYISITCVEVDNEEVRRRLRKEAPPPPAHMEDDEEVYDDVCSTRNMSSFDAGFDVYDDVDSPIPDEFPPPPPEIVRQDLRKNKNMVKEENEFRKKFKFEGPIKVLQCVMVDPNANIKKGGGKDLAVARGDILDVIQITSNKKALCRNEQGKYGYVPRAYLLEAEGDIYDDVDHIDEVYDNDPCTAPPWKT